MKYVIVCRGTSDFVLEGYETHYRVVPTYEFSIEHVELKDLEKVIPQLSDNYEIVSITQDHTGIPF